MRTSNYSQKESFSFLSHELIKFPDFSLTSMEFPDFSWYSLTNFQILYFPWFPWFLWLSRNPVFYRLWKNTVQFAHVECDFISFYLIGFAFTMTSSDYKSHWNIIVFYDQWKIMPDLNMSHGKMSDFVSIPLFGFTLVIKLRNFDSESHWNISIFFDKERYGVRFEYVQWTNIWICFISIVWFHFSQKIEKFWF